MLSDRLSLILTKRVTVLCQLSGRGVPMVSALVYFSVIGQFCNFELK